MKVIGYSKSHTVKKQTLFEKNTWLSRILLEMKTKTINGIQPLQVSGRQTKQQRKPTPNQRFLSVLEIDSVLWFKCAMSPTGSSAGTIGSQQEACLVEVGQREKAFECKSLFSCNALCSALSCYRDMKCCHQMLYHNALCQAFLALMD